MTRSYHALIVFSPVCLLPIIVCVTGDGMSGVNGRLLHGVTEFMIIYSVTMTGDCSEQKLWCGDCFFLIIGVWFHHSPFYFYLMMAVAAENNSTPQISRPKFSRKGILYGYTFFLLLMLGNTNLTHWLTDKEEIELLEMTLSYEPLLCFPVNQITCFLRGTHTMIGDIMKAKDNWVKPGSTRLNRFWHNLDYNTVSNIVILFVFLCAFEIQTALTNYDWVRELLWQLSVDKLSRWSRSLKS